METDCLHAFWNDYFHNICFTKTVFLNLFNPFFQRDFPFPLYLFELILDNLVCYDLRSMNSDVFINYTFIWERALSGIHYLRRHFNLCDSSSVGVVDSGILKVILEINLHWIVVIT